MRNVGAASIWRSCEALVLEDVEVKMFCCDLLIYTSSYIVVNVL